MKFNYIRRFKTLWRKKSGFLRPWEFQLFACRCNWGFRSALLKCVMCGATSSPSKRSSPSVYITPDYLLLGSTTCWDSVLEFLPFLNFLSYFYIYIFHGPDLVSPFTGNSPSCVLNWKENCFLLRSCLRSS